MTRNTIQNVLPANKQLGLLVAALVLGMVVAFGSNVVASNPNPAPAAAEAEFEFNWSDAYDKWHAENPDANFSPSWFENFKAHAYDNAPPEYQGNPEFHAWFNNGANEHWYGHAEYNYEPKPYEKTAYHKGPAYSPTGYVNPKFATPTEPNKWQPGYLHKSGAFIPQKEFVASYFAPPANFDQPKAKGQAVGYAPAFDQPQARAWNISSSTPEPAPPAFSFKEFQEGAFNWKGQWHEPQWAPNFKAGHK